MRYIRIFGGWLTSYCFIYFGFVSVRDEESSLSLVAFVAFVIIGYMALCILGILNPNLRFGDYKKLLKKLTKIQ